MTCLGCIGTAQKVPLLRDARALLAPIEWNEPFGLILIEAMLSGCPVVAFGPGSVPELIEPGVTGFIAGSIEDMVGSIRPGGAVDRLDRRVIRAGRCAASATGGWRPSTSVCTRRRHRGARGTDRRPITAA